MIYILRVTVSLYVTCLHHKLVVLHLPYSSRYHNIRHGCVAVERAVEGWRTFRLG